MTFDNEILGVFTSPSNTIAMTGISKSGAYISNMSSDKIGMRDLEYKNDNAPGQQGNKDWFEFQIQTRPLKLEQKTVIKVTLFVSLQELLFQTMHPVGEMQDINEDAVQ